MLKKKVDTIPILSNAIKQTLDTLILKRSLPASLKQRVQIALLSSQGCTNQVISEKVGLHYNNVAVWRNRFLETIPILNEIEVVSPEKLIDIIQELFTDKHRSGCHSKFTQEQIIKIIDLACKSPSEFDYEVSQWSLTLLVREIKKQGIAEQISVGTVHRFLKMGQI